MSTDPTDRQWIVHVEGPDEIYYMSTEDAAREYAAALNAEFSTWPKTEYTPTLTAVVYEPGSQP